MQIARWGLLLALAAGGCNAPEGGTRPPGAGTGNGGGIAGGAGGTGGAGGASGAGGQDGTFAVGVGGNGSGVGADDGCAERAELVYVLSQDNELYSFRPDRKEFTRIGRLDCPTDMEPNSMAIDRDAVAWVNYVEADAYGDIAGTLFKVSTEDARCEPTSIALTGAWSRLGMGFSSDATTPAAEQLFVTSAVTGRSQGLGRLDGTSITPIGEFSGALRGAYAELTGTGDGRLFGFFTTSPVELAEIDKGTGEILSSTPLPGIETPSAWAFSFWGGDFYIYTAPSQTEAPSRTTNVARYRPSDGSIDTSYMTNIGFRIVGAGVSTCAPIEPPR